MHVDPVIMTSRGTSTRSGSSSHGSRFGTRSSRTLSVAELPDPNTQRWVVARKAAVVAAVQNGILTIDGACRRYSLSLEEFLSWAHLVQYHGLAGLRVTRIRDYRACRSASSPDPEARALPTHAGER